MRRLADLGAELLEHVRPFEHAVEDPGERRRRRLVPGQQQRQHLVPQLLVRHRRAVVVARLDEHRQHVVASGATLGAAPADLGEEDLVDVARDADEPAPRREEPEVDLQEGEQHERCEAAAGHREEAREPLAEPRERRSLRDAEHGPHDHVEREGLHVGVDRKRLPERPPIDRAVRDVAHDRAVRLHPFAVERRHQEPPLREVPRAVEDEERVIAEQPEERAVRLAGAQPIGVGREDLADRVGMAEEDEGRVGGKADREDVAEAPGAVLHERNRPVHPVEELDDRRGGGAGRKRRHGRL